MDRTYFLIMAALALGWLAAAASPALVLLTGARDSPMQLAGARRMLRLSAFVVAVAMGHIANVSFASHAVNVIVEGFALLFGLVWSPTCLCFGHACWASWRDWMRWWRGCC
jgi:hypothetical protein